MSVAHAGGEIIVEPGSYHEQVLLTKRLKLRGLHSPTVDARGFSRGIVVQGAKAAGSVIQGFTVVNATYEGILALDTERLTIVDNVVRHNDLGYFASHVTGECKAHQHQGSGLGDLRKGGCGEAIHLVSSSYSRIQENLVTDNTGGVYLTDEYGPAAHNLITLNKVVGNVYDCGITLASHSGRAVAANGQPQPRLGGIYDNTITRNIASGNGLRVSGSGILVAAAFSGGAAYGNRIIDNTVNDNGEPGITLHSHDPRQDLNGNVIENNVIGRNAVTGGSHGGPGDDIAGVSHTAGILVWSAFVRITQLKISGNRISNNYFGVWTLNTPRLSQAANQFTNVTVALSQH